MLQPKVFSGWLGVFTPAAVMTIAINTNLSSVIQCQGQCLCGIQLPAAFTSTTITFNVSIDGTTFQPLKSTTSGTALSYTIAQGEYIAINPADFYGVNYLQIQTGSNETAARAFTVALRGL